MLREEFIKGLIKQDLIDSAIMYRDPSVGGMEKIYLFINDINKKYKLKLNIQLGAYQNDNLDYSIIFEQKPIEEFNEIFATLRYCSKDKDIHMFKVITNDCIEKEYSDLFNEKDLEDHISVGMVIIDVKSNKILMLDHVKCNMLTVPVGKAEKDESPFDAVCKEVKEEVNLDIKEAYQICRFDMVNIKNDKEVKQYNYLFVTDISDKDISNLKNMEPTKHRKMFWMNKDKLLDLKTNSFMTNVIIDIFKNNCIITSLSIPKLNVLHSFNTLGIIEDGITHRVSDTIEYKIDCVHYLNNVEL